MTGLEQAFYIMGIVFMSIMFIIMLVLVTAVFVIRSKVNKIHDHIEQRLEMITSLAERGGELSALASNVVIKKAKKALKKKK